MANLRSIVRERFGEKQNIISKSPGVIGDGIGNVEVPGRPGYVWVTVAAGGVFPVLNTLAEPTHGRSVWVGYNALNPGTLQIIAENIAGSESSGLGVISGGRYAPATRYQLYAKGGGQDPLWVEGYQFLPFRIYPAGGLTVKVYPTLYKTKANDLLTVSGVTDLASYAPTGEGEGRLVLITLSETGTIVATPGDTVILDEVTHFEIPADPDGTVMRLALVRLYYGQAAIVAAQLNGDINDLRAGGSLGSGIPAMVDLTDVDPTGLADGVTPVYDEATEKFIFSVPAGGGDVIGPASVTPGNLAVFGADGQHIEDGGAVPTGGGGDYILIRDEKAQGTNGGNFPSGSQQTRDLNTIVSDAGGHVSLSGNQITILHAGTYRFRVLAPAYAVVHHQARLYDITNTAVLGLGQTALADYNNEGMTNSEVIGEFTITGTTVIEVQHQCSFSYVYGFGFAANLGTEIYTIVELRKIA